MYLFTLNNFQLFQIVKAMNFIVIKFVPSPSIYLIPQIPSFFSVESHYQLTQEHSVFQDFLGHSGSAYRQKLCWIRNFDV